MKHIKEFERWTTTSTDDVVVNYGDKKPEYSDIVKFTTKLIEDNIDNISEHYYNTQEQTYELHFKNIDEGITKISLNYGTSISSISFTFGDTTKNIDITSTECKYLIEFFLQIIIKVRKKLQLKDKNDIYDIIDPIKRAAKKYNI